MARTKKKKNKKKNEQRSTNFERTYFLNGLFMSFLGTLEIEKIFFAKIRENIQMLREKVVCFGSLWDILSHTQNWKN